MSPEFPGTFFALLKRLPVAVHIHNGSRDPGLFNGAGHEMAFHTAGNGTFGVCGILQQSGCEVFHDPVITTAVTAFVLDVGGQISACFCLSTIAAEMGDFDTAVQFITVDLTMFTHDVDIPVYTTLQELQGASEDAMVGTMTIGTPA